MAGGFEGVGINGGEGSGVLVGDPGERFLGVDVFEPLPFVGGGGAVGEGGDVGHGGQLLVVGDAHAPILPHRSDWSPSTPRRDDGPEGYLVTSGSAAARVQDAKDSDPVDPAPVPHCVVFQIEPANVRRSACHRSPSSGNSPNRRSASRSTVRQMSSCSLSKCHTCIAGCCGCPAAHERKIRVQ